MDEVINTIKEKWDLPSAYLEYLAKFPKKGKYIEDDRFVNGLSIYGASELINNQEGYSYNPIQKKIIDEWPMDYIVIADDGGDPYVLDLSQSNGEEAPILFAYHGEGEWDFEEYSPTFTEFLESLNIV